MLKKLFATLAIAAVPFTASQAESTIPNVLAGLDSSIQVMDEQQLNEVRGAGIIPNDYTYTEFHYAWNFYGAQSDYRSYISTGGATWYGGKKDYPADQTTWIGEAYLVTFDGINAPMNTYGRIEEHALEVDANLEIQDYSHFSLWNRPWDGVWRFHVSHY